MSDLTKYLVTAALPYANAPLHLGHLRSTYIPADIYTRYLRLHGHDVVYVCATDEHGTPIAVRAEQEKTSPKKIVDRYHKSIHQDLLGVGCSLDIFSRTSTPVHRKTTQEFFSKLLEKGYIYDSQYKQLFCSKCKRFLPDRYVEGTCPHCGAEGARGDACDACGRYLKPTDLTEPYCLLCKGKPVVKTSRHWFFKLSAFHQEIREWITNNPNLTNNVKKYALQWIDEGLKDWCITRDLSWGVPVPIADVENKIIYVWFDAPIGYLSSTKIWASKSDDPEKWRTYWQEKDSKIVHFIGKDIIYHHSIFWPAMLWGVEDYNLPSAIVAGEYLTLEGRKMSKSRGWVVDVSNYLKDFEPDSLRYYLIAASPLSKDADFSWDEFARRHNNELADILGNFVHRALVFAHNNFQGRIPDHGEFDQYDQEVLNSLSETQQEVAEAIEHFNFHQALRTIMELASTGNKYFNDKSPWLSIKENPQTAKTTVYIANQIVKALSILLEPFLPFTAEKIWNTLGLKGSVHNQNWGDIASPLQPGQQIKRPIPLFNKIETERIEAKKQQLPGLGVEEQKSEITAEEFARLDLRIGKILEAKAVPSSNELLHLTIDLGDGIPRNSISGLLPHYTPETLKGKSVAVLVNIKQTEILGVTSEVMLLAVIDGKKLGLLVPDHPARPGSPIK
ncbi:methionine--tRNA ligase [Candidatus Bathyarchaeota archaeon]|nr:methionine--tRNA ligase [Candidatus Bathyarchaeota archaeon]